MKIVRVDSKRRVLLPKAQPGDFMAVSERAGQYTLERIRLPERPALSKEKCHLAMEENPISVEMDWESLREITREP